MAINQNVIKKAKYALARKDFYYYCQLKTPTFYKKDRAYLEDLCNSLQGFLESDDKVLLINMPPRHGKTFSIAHFIEWLFGNDNTKKIMMGSYNETLSTTFSKMVRNTITEVKADEDKVVYSDIFPDTKIQFGDGAANLWSLEKGNNNYLATSPTGTATGFGANLIVIDDLIKNAQEANNALNREKQWSWFTDTMLSRLEGNDWKVIIVMTRWHTKDLAGKLIQHCEENDIAYKQVLYKAVQDDGSMLCDDILNRESYTIKTKTMSIEIAEANYQQKPIDLKGTLYTKFKTYEDVPVDLYGRAKFEIIKAYTDTADTGEDFLCSVVYGIYKNEAYVLDVYYTKEHMEITEKKVAEQFTKYKVDVADVEGNNGGRGFGRAVERNMQDMGNYHTVIETFHQSNNKNARILSNATWCMEHIYYPSNWRDRFPEFYQSMQEYQKEGKNEHDDAQDAITGISEKINEGGGIQFG